MIKICKPFSEYNVDYQRSLMERYKSDTFEDKGYLWGHNHDFGPFQVQGRMADRHLSIMRILALEFGRDDFKDKDVLDVGCWSGGISLLLNSMGANVTAVDTNLTHLEPFFALQNHFDLGINIWQIESLQNWTNNFYQRFDVIMFAGVIYHCRDPLGALLSLGFTLRPGGKIIVESMACGKDGFVCEYRGKGTGLSSGSNYFVPSAQCLGKWLDDTGFTVEKATFHGQRAIAVASK